MKHFYIVQLDKITQAILLTCMGAVSNQIQHKI